VQKSLVLYLSRFQETIGIAVKIFKQLFLTYWVLLGLFISPLCYAQTSDNTLKLGDIAPEIVMYDVYGMEHKLSKIKKKVILIDFWASWCRPCRIDNPKFIEIYDKYKNKKFKKESGFEVFSVSLDNIQDKWIEAVNDDAIPWEHNGSQLRGWYSSFVKDYNINSIPANYVVDGNGKIIAINVKPTELDHLLKKRK